MTLDPNERVVSRTFHAIARCAACHWSAAMTGDTEDEVAYFLHALLMEHVNRLHKARRERPS